jgi:hypothetical protein
MPRTTPVIATEVPGDFITSALWNAQVLATMQWLFGTGASSGVPRFSGYASTAQAFATGTSYSPLNLDAEVYDSEGGHSTTTNSSRYTVQVPGLYRITAQSAFAVNSSGARAVAIGVNGTASKACQGAPPPSNSWSNQVTWETYLNVGDFVEAMTWQNSGGALSTVTGGMGPSLSVWWIGNN